MNGEKTQNPTASHMNIPQGPRDDDKILKSFQIEKQAFLQKNKNHIGLKSLSVTLDVRI